jgi:hypothetical protein
MKQYNCLDLSGYFDEDTRINLWVHMKDGETKYIKDVRAQITWDDEWFTCETDKPEWSYSLVARPAIYFRSQDVAYFEVWPTSDPNKPAEQYNEEGMFYNANA